MRQIKMQFGHPAISKSKSYTMKYFQLCKLTKMKNNYPLNIICITCLNLCVVYTVHNTPPPPPPPPPNSPRSRQCYKLHLFKLIEVIVLLLHVQTLQLCDQVLYVPGIIKETWKWHMAERFCQHLRTSMVCNNIICIYMYYIHTGTLLLGITFTECYFVLSNRLTLCSTYLSCSVIRLSVTYLASSMKSRSDWHVNRNENSKQHYNFMPDAILELSSWFWWFGILCSFSNSHSDMSLSCSVSICEEYAAKSSAVLSSSKPEQTSWSPRPSR